MNSSSPSATEEDSLQNLIKVSYSEFVWHFIYEFPSKQRSILSSISAEIPGLYLVDNCTNVSR